MKVLAVYVMLYRKVTTLKQIYNVDKEIRYWKSNKKELLELGKRRYRLRIEDLGLSQEKFKLLRKLQQQSHEVVIAEVDQDGFLLSNFGPIRNAPIISKKQFLARKKFNIKVVALNGYVGVKKDYKGNKVAFVNEIKALYNLGLAGCNVPAIMDIDFDSLTLTFSYIFGSVLREELAKKGAILRDRDIDNNPDYTHLTPEKRWLKRIQEGKRVLSDVVNLEFIEDLFIELKKVHASGFILGDIKYGNIIIEKISGKPYLIDFEHTKDYSKLGKKSFGVLCDQEIERLNLHFDTEKLTTKEYEKKLKAKIDP